MKIFLQLFITTLVLYSCSKEDDFGNDKVIADEICDLQIMADGFLNVNSDTRTSDNGYTTTFRNDDQAGVITVVGGLFKSNIPFRYNNGNWGLVDAAKAVYKYPGASYIVYYPYVEGMEATNRDQLETKFVVPENQTNQDAYAKADLMIDDAATLNDKQLTAKLKHAFALLQFSGPIEKYTFDGNTYSYNLTVRMSEVNIEISGVTYSAWVNNRESRILVKPCSIPLTWNVKCQNNGTTFSKSTTATSFAAGKYYKITSSGEVNTGEYWGQYGDFYCLGPGNKGYPVPVDTWRSLSAKPTCYGKVFYVGRHPNDKCTYISNYNLLTVHGYVGGYIDAADSYIDWFDGFNWDKATRYVSSDTEAWNGYDNSQRLKDAGNISAVNAAIAYSLNTRNPKYPIHTSGWFLPSYAQLRAFHCMDMNPIPNAGAWRSGPHGCLYWSSTIASNAVVYIYDVVGSYNTIGAYDPSAATNGWARYIRPILVY